MADKKSPERKNRGIFFLKNHPQSLDHTENHNAIASGFAILKN